MIPEALVTQIKDCGIIAVLVIDRVEDAVPLARALLAGGVQVMELTLRTPAALEALRHIKAEVPEMLAGAGTILTPKQVGEVKAAGAAFAVSPGVNLRVLEAAREADLPFAPGVVTPSDIEQALEFECRSLKFFPAEPSGGLPYLKAIAAPYQHLEIEFFPLGGLNAQNMAAYLSDPLIAAIGGSWLAPREAVRAGRWEKITTLAQAASSTIRAVRV